MTGHVLTGDLLTGDRWTGDLYLLRELDCGLRSGDLPRVREGLLYRVGTGSGDGLVRLGERLS